MKEKIGAILYQLLMLIVGVCLIIGGIISIKKHKSYLVITGGFAIGIGMIVFAVQGLARIARENTVKKMTT